MPLKKCSVDGKGGYKWGDQGHCYTGPDGKKKAIKQGYAENPKKFKQEMASAENDEVISEEDLRQVAIESMFQSSSDGDTGKPHSGNCPTCNEKFVSQCRCFRSDMTCANGHKWHRGKNGNSWLGQGH